MQPSTETPSPADHSQEKAPPGRHLAVLDGWRAISILLVLTCHMLPVGLPSWDWDMNFCFGLMGMSIFFTLSGFLITSTLLKSPSVLPFLIRRLARILPLAWLATVVFLAIVMETRPAFYFNTLLFTINYETQYTSRLTGHFWSLCVEMHFYVVVALLVLLAGRRGLWLLPILGFAVTGLRVWYGAKDSNETHLRVDEILAGASLALIWFHTSGSEIPHKFRWYRRLAVLTIAILFLLSCHRMGGSLMYARPYFGMALVGITLFATGRTRNMLGIRPLRYIAKISYALYIVHPVTYYGWLGSGETLVKYAKRPLCFALTFFLAHISTHYYERPATDFGKWLSLRWSRPRKTIPTTHPATESPVSQTL